MSATCQGNSPLSASSPPTILVLPRTPHSQFPVTGGAWVVVVVVVGEGRVGLGGGTQHASVGDKKIPSEGRYLMTFRKRTLVYDLVLTVFRVMKRANMNDK